jgi:hypothetical protein
VSSNRKCGDPKELGVKVVVECPEDSKPVVCVEPGRPIEVSCESQGGG